MAAFNSPPSKQEYAKLVIDALHQAGDERPIQYDQEKFRLVVEGPKHVLKLANLYGEYVNATPKERENMLRRTVQSWLALAIEFPDSLEEARTDLLPLVRARSYLQVASIEAQINGKEPPAWPHQVVGEHLAVSLAYDLPHGIRTITQEELDDWGITFYEGLEIALDNLRHMECQMGVSESLLVYISSSGDYYDASRLIYLDFMRQLEVEGDHVAMVPNRNQLIVTGSDDEAGLAVMADLAQEILQEPRRLSGIAFRLVGDDWEPWLPPERHPSWKAFKRLLVQTMSQEYAVQKELLGELQTKMGDDTFIAEFCAATNEQGKLLSYCVWSKGVRSLLPQTDIVGFYEPSLEPVMADWDKVFQVCGHMMKPKDWYPGRYFVDEFPTVDELHQMGAVPLSHRGPRNTQ